MFFYKKYNLLRINSRLVLGLLGLVILSPCIFGPLILDYFQIEGVDEESGSGKAVTAVVVVLGLLGLAMIILSLSGGTPRAVLDEIRSRSVPKHFSEALSVLCILLAVSGGLVALNSEGQTSLIGLVVGVLAVAGWIGFGFLSKPTLRELAKGSIHHVCLLGDVVEIDRHLANGTDVNLRDESLACASPLHWMCLQESSITIDRHKGGYFLERTRLEVVKHLIANGADLNLRITKGEVAGMTPLDLARLNEENEVAELLEQHGGVSSGLSIGQLEYEKPSA